MAETVIAIVAIVAGSAAGAAAASAVGYAIAGYVVGYIVARTLQDSLTRLLIPGPDTMRTAPDMVSTTRGLRNNYSAPDAYLPVVYGRFRLGGNVVMAGLGAPPYEDSLFMCLVIGEGELYETIADYNIWVNGYQANDPTSPYYNEDWDYCYHNGDDEQGACGTPVLWLPGWTVDHKLSGVAYTFFRFKYSEVMANHGIPYIEHNPDGRLCFDPRTSTTAWTQNPVLFLRDYLTNSRYGLAIPTAELDEASFIAAANYCEEDVEHSPGVYHDRYEGRGVLDPSRPPLECIKGLLSAFRGYLIFTAGRYRVIIDKPETATLTFDEDHITGSIKGHLGSKDTRANRVTARYFDRAALYGAATETADDPTLRANEDGGELLKRDIDLPYTSTWYHARYICQLTLQQLRYGKTVEFTTDLYGLLAEPGDVINLTHSKPGWTAKKFRVAQVTLLSNDEVQLRVFEYDANVYTWTPVSPKSTPVTLTPMDNAYQEQPGVPDLAELLVGGRAGGGRKSVAAATWMAPASGRVKHYEVQYRTAPDGDWIETGPRRELRAVVPDLTPDMYDVRVRAVNERDVRSAWSLRMNFRVYGPLAPPTDPTGLEVSQHYNWARLRWTASTDEDVADGGRYIVKHCIEETGATWDKGNIWADSLPGKTDNVVLPLLDGTYMLKAIDAKGQHSAGMASGMLQLHTAHAWTATTTITEDSTFPGTKTNCTVSGGKLKLTVSGGMVNPSGSYAFNTSWASVSTLTTRVRAHIKCCVVAENTTVDNRAANVDDWENFDGAAGAQANAQIYYRKSDNYLGGNWTDWRPLTNEEIAWQKLEFKCELRSTELDYNIEIEELRVHREDI